MARVVYIFYILCFIISSCTDSPHGRCQLDSDITIRSLHVKKSICENGLDLIEEVNVDSKERRTYYTRNNTIDSIYQEYYATGIHSLTGYYKSGKQNGWFSYYNQNGKLHAMREFINMYDTNIARLNQVIIFKENGDTDKTQSMYYNFYSSGKTIKNGDTLFFKFLINGGEFQAKQVAFYDASPDFKPLNKDIYYFTILDNGFASHTSEYHMGDNFVCGNFVLYKSVYDTISRHNGIVGAKLFFYKKFTVEN